jgi:hypothetical protein
LLKLLFYKREIINSVLSNAFSGAKKEIVRKSFGEFFEFYVAKTFNVFLRELPILKVELRTPKTYLGKVESDAAKKFLTMLNNFMGNLWALTLGKQKQIFFGLAG